VVDAGGIVDAGRLDGGAVDAGPVADGGPAADAGQGADGGVVDAGPSCAAAQMCGTACCEGAAVCRFGSCVVPADVSCVDAHDCADGDICERSLADVPAATCPVSLGRCLERPVRCDEDDVDGCLRTCQPTRQAGAVSTQTLWTWGAEAAPAEFPLDIDVWSAPAVGRLVDADCDGAITRADPPVVIVVTRDLLQQGCSTMTQRCRQGLLRALDGVTGTTLWTLAEAEQGSAGFAGVSVAMADVDDDGLPEVVALTAEGRVAIISGDGTVEQVSTDAIAAHNDNTLGGGGGLAVGDMNNDGVVEVAFGDEVFTFVDGVLTLLFAGTTPMRFPHSHFASLTAGPTQELVAQRAAYDADGFLLWQQPALPVGHTAVADFDGDGAVEVVHVAQGRVSLLDGATGDFELASYTLPAGNGGPPVIADLDGDGAPEIGVAGLGVYTVLEANYANGVFDEVWSMPTADASSSTTASSAFDFDDDGRAEILFADTCFFWVFDGATGTVRLAHPTRSSTRTELPVVADVDGDGSAEVVLVQNELSALSCATHDGFDGLPAWTPSSAGAYRGVTVLRGVEKWPLARALWNQHAYSAGAVCDSDDDACPTASHASVASGALTHVPWADGMRVNGLAHASAKPELAVWAQVLCTSPTPTAQVQVRHVGDVDAAPAPTGVGVELVDVDTGAIVDVMTLQWPLRAGQTAVFDVDVPMATARVQARLTQVNDVGQCDVDNDASSVVEVVCP